MSWTGRKRSAGARFPSGKLKPRKPPKPPEQPHRRGFGNQPLAGTVHGRYFLKGDISHAQFVAGELFARARAMYRAAIGAPDSLRSHDERHPYEAEERDDVKAVAQFEEVRRLLGHLAVDVEWVTVQDAMLSDLTTYREGLNILRRIYRV